MIQELLKSITLAGANLKLYKKLKKPIKLTEASFNDISTSEVHYFSRGRTSKNISTFEVHYFTRKGL